MIDPTPYLNRIKFTGSTSPTLENLQKLQRQHLLTVPFENLDIHYGNPIHLDVDSFYQKIVYRGRGGFCYELNGLFQALLTSLGFDTKIVSSRVYNEDKEEYSPEFDHLAIIVNLDGTNWLADVGFGDFIQEPLNIDTDEEQTDRNGVFRIRRVKSDFIVEKMNENSAGWQPEYKFCPVKRNLADFKSRCRFHQNSADSHFREKKVCSRMTETGRITLTDQALKIQDGDQIEKRPVHDLNDFEYLLEAHFGITIR